MLCISDYTKKYCQLSKQIFEQRGIVNSTEILQCYALCQCVDYTTKLYRAANERTLFSKENYNQFYSGRVQCRLAQPRDYNFFALVVLWLRTKKVISVFTIGGLEFLN